MRKIRRMLLICTLMLIAMLCAGTVSAESIRLNQKKLTLFVGQSENLTLLNAPASEVTWSTKATRKLSVDENGLVTAKKQGKAYVRAYYNGKRYRCKITILQPVTAIRLKKTEVTVKPGKKVKLKATVIPATADNPKLKWTSSDKSIAKVNKNGKVRGIAEGTATITATAADGSGVSVECTVTVSESGTKTVDPSNPGTTDPTADPQEKPVVTVPGQKQPSARARIYLQVLQSYSDQIVKDAQNNFNWVYDSSYGSKGPTWEVERKNAIARGTANVATKTVKNEETGEETTVTIQGPKIGYCNCALLVRWALKDPKLKLLTSSESFWSKWDSSTQTAGFYFNGSMKKNMSKFYENFEIITVDKTPAALLAEGNLLPGDICGWNGMQHTNVYAGNGTWYEGGRVSVGGYRSIMIDGKNQANRYVFTSFGPVKGIGMSPSGGRTIHQIIRIK
ncbi:MAG: Ig-like domain-containing protein [Eubacteriales bacterium]|nr:Ig-like domain-containing protein [Eubacteriales bacterium]